ncbi:hypothetical protein GCM10028778_19300 [Barrientosiimonas marina]
MFNKLITGSLTAALVFGGALTTADASPSSDHLTNQLYQNPVSFAMNGNDWTNSFATQMNPLGNYFPQIQWDWGQEDDDASSQQGETDQDGHQEQDNPDGHNDADHSAHDSGQNTGDQHQGNADKPDIDDQQSNQPEQPNTGAQHQNPSEQPNTDDQHQSEQPNADDQHQNQSGQQEADGQQQDHPGQADTNDQWHQDQSDQPGTGDQQQDQSGQPNTGGQDQSDQPGTDDQQQDIPEQQPNKQQSGQSSEQQSQQNQGSQQVSSYEQQVAELTNEERTSRGLEPLKIDTSLSNVAHKKSSDMASNNYFSHDSPNYGSPFDMIKQFGISYQTAGENIARGQKTPKEVVDGWMDSKGHRENILNSDFTHIGVGYVKDGNYWTQEFIGK